MKKKVFTLVGSICLILVLAALPFMTACAAPAPAPTPTPTPTPAPTPVPTPPTEPIVLKGVSFLPAGLMWWDGLREYISRVNEAAKGELIIDWLGGPEVIPMFDQPEAVRTGAMDWMACAGTFYAPLLPDVETLYISPLSISEQRGAGYYDYLVERHKTINLRLIGYNLDAGTQYLFTNIKVDHPQELKGQRMRSAYLYDLFMKALGITPITMPGGDIYTALERGLIDGYAESADMVGRGWYEVCKYMIFPGFYHSLDVGTNMNLDKFNSLPEHLQQLLLDVQKDLEPWLESHWSEVIETIIQVNKEHGVEFIEFTGEDAEWYLNLAYQVKWDDLEKRMPEVVAKVKPMFEKK